MATIGKDPVNHRVEELRKRGDALHRGTSASPTQSPVSAAGAPRTALTPFQKLLSLGLFSAMWLTPQILDKNGWSSTIGAEFAMPWGLPRLYTGTATHGNLSFFFFYTAWIRYMSTIVGARHRIRLETASIWIPSVIMMLVFSPLGCFVFLGTLSFYGVLEFRNVLAPEYSQRGVDTSPSTQSSRQTTAQTTDANSNTPALPAWPLTVPAVVIPMSSVLGWWSLLGGVSFGCFLIMLVLYPILFPTNTRRVLALDIFALLYVATGLAVAGITSLGPYGRGWFFLALSCSWIGDAGAYFIGSRYGKHKCFPSVSPGKSWEGIVSQLVFTLVATWLVMAAHWSGASFLGVPPLSLPEQLLASLALTLAGVAGDLSESFLKRVVDVKDSGDFFPGHGGVLDRFDGFLFSSIALTVLPILFDK